VTIEWEIQSQSLCHKITILYIFILVVLKQLREKPWHPKLQTLANSCLDTIVGGVHSVVSLPAFHEWKGWAQQQHPDVTCK
jgi:hypothetical protein